MTATAREIAKELHRQRRRRRLVLLVIVIAAIAAAVTYLTCGRGFGLGGKGEGSGSGPGPAVVRDAAPTRCAVRVTRDGLTVNGASATRDEVIAACKPSAGADVVVTGDARQGDWDDLRSALEAAGIPTFTKQR